MSSSIANTTHMKSLSFIFYLKFMFGPMPTYNKRYNTNNTIKKEGSGNYTFAVDTPFQGQEKIDSEMMSKL
jgi:hypothetical protein